MENNAKTIDIQIKCLHCAKWFPSGIWLGDRISFESGMLFGNKQRCPHCHQLTGCNKENFKARFEDGGFIGVDA